MHPELWDGLVFAVAPQLGSTGYRFAEPKGRIGTLYNNATITNDPDLHGYAIDIPGSAATDSVGYGNIDRCDFGEFDPFTALVWFRIDTLPSAFTDLFSQRSSSGDTPGWLLGVNSTNKPYAILNQSAASRLRRDVNATTLVAGTTYFFGVRYKGTSEVVDFRTYLNGVITTSDTTPNNTLSGSPVSGASLSFGARNNGGTSASVDGLYGPAYVWNRTISSTLIRRLYHDPFALWRPRSRPYYKPILATGGWDSVYPSLLVPDGSEPAVAAEDVFFENRHPIEHGMKPLTAAGMSGVLIE
jgi:hypothetical protein